MFMNSDEHKRIAVYFDGGCPVCSREIAFYRDRARADVFQWVDVSTCSPASMGSGLSREMAMRRMHVRDREGRLHGGAAAFAELWRNMPGMRWLGRLLAVPPFGAIAEAGYRIFLALRKSWRRPA